MAMTEEEWQQVLWLLGPWLIGGFLDFLLQGILFCQFVNYFVWYKDDKQLLRWMVVGLVVITTLKSAQTLLLVWEQSIVYFTDVEGAVALSYTKWWQTGNGLMVASIGAYVQSYFCFRLYAISRRVWVIIPVATILTFAYSASVVATYYTAIFNTPKIGLWFAAHLSSVFAGDTLLALTTAYYLVTSTRHSLVQTKALANALVRLTFQTATPAALCAMLNLVFSQIYSGEDRLVSAAFNTALPKIYAISMMWTLNARRSIRIGHSSGHLSSSGELTGRSRRRDDVELGRLGTIGTIQIRTEIETVHHADENGRERGLVFIDAKPESAFNRSDDDSQSQHDTKSYKGTAV
ncbi:hypothetical protein M0805_003226 [Coniferiporia weirii]|nr:hypothetical protein M0805_003226 [Coniferiporia weirii]